MKKKSVFILLILFLIISTFPAFGQNRIAEIQQEMSYATLVLNGLLKYKMECMFHKIN